MVPYIKSKYPEKLLCDVYVFISTHKNTEMFMEIMNTELRIVVFSSDNERGACSIMSIISQ